MEGRSALYHGGLRTPTGVGNSILHRHVRIPQMRDLFQLGRNSFNDCIGLLGDSFRTDCLV